MIFIVNQKSMMSHFHKISFWEVNLQNVHKVKVFFFFSNSPGEGGFEKKTKQNTSHLNSTHLLSRLVPVTSMGKWLSQILPLTYFIVEELEAWRWREFTRIIKEVNGKAEIGIQISQVWLPRFYHHGTLSLQTENMDTVMRAYPFAGLKIHTSGM